MSYNTAAVRKLLTTVFDDQELIVFCYDHFRPVYNKFAFEMGRLWKIQLLIDYCEKYDQFDELLTRVRDVNPGQYAKFISSVKGDSQTPKADISASKSQVEITFKGHLSNFTPDLQFAVVGALAGVLNISRDQISVSRVQDGSIILQLEMPTEAISQLIALYEANDPIIQDLGIQQVRLIPKQAPQTAAPIPSGLHGKSQRALEPRNETSMQKTKYETALKIIDNAAWVSGCIAGAIGIIPGSFLFDVPALGVVNINMIMRLGELFDQKLDKKLVTAFFSEIAAVAIGVGTAAIVASFVPGVAILTNGVVAYGVTQLIGRCAYIIFAQEKNLDDFEKGSLGTVVKDSLDKKKWLETLIDIHVKRLIILEEKRATYGFECPPHIIMEIEIIKNEIAALRKDLDNMRK